MEWSRIALAWGRELLDVPPAEAEARARQCDLLMGGYAGFADAILITSVRDHYRALASRPTAKESLETLLSNFLFDRVYLIEVSEPGGKMCYYSRSRYEERKPTACLMGFAANDIRQNFFAKNVVRCSLSPQSAQVNAIRKALQEDPSHARWEGTMLEAMRHLADDVKIDPIAKRILMIQVARAGSEGSTGFRAAILETLTRLEDRNIPEGMFWMDPGKNDACGPVREGITRTIGALRLDLVPETAKASRSALSDAYRGIPRPVGVLARPKQDEWRCIVPDVPARNGRLLVIVPDAGRSVWKRIGAVRDHKVVLAATEADLFVRGRLLFFAAE